MTTPIFVPPGSSPSRGLQPEPRPASASALELVRKALASVPAPAQFNLQLVLDVSSSLWPYGKFRKGNKAAMDLVASTLGAQDGVGVIGFEQRVHVLQPLGPLGSTDIEEVSAWARRHTTDVPRPGWVHEHGEAHTWLGLVSYHF